MIGLLFHSLGFMLTLGLAVGIVAVLVGVPLWLVARLPYDRIPPGLDPPPHPLETED